MFHRHEEDEPICDINVVPLADVSLVLLIILLILSPMAVESRLHVRTAAKKAGDPAATVRELPPERQRELVLVVDLGPNGYMVGQVFLTHRREFTAYMRLELSSRSDRKVFLAPHPDIEHGTVVETIETLKACGASAVALVQTGGA